MLNLYHLKYFHDAATHRSLVASARVNRVSHSAVSQAIRSLEEQVGVKLLVHARRRFELSSEGAALFRDSGQVLGQLERSISGARSAGVRPTGPLRLGLSHSLGMSYLAEPLARFARKHPQVEPVLRIGNSASLEQLLSSREIELGFGIEDGSFVRYERAELARGEFVLAAARTGAQDGVYLVGDKGLEVTSLRGLLRAQGVRFVEVQSWELIARLVETGLGQGLLPEFVARPLERAGRVRVRRRRGLPGYRLCAFYRSWTGLSPGAREFLRGLGSAPVKSGRS